MFQPGSPPPMRGKAASMQTASFRLGITPAYAGKRLCWYAYEGFPQDHPRLCGEKKQKSVSSLTVPGSPPPMRGKGFFADFRSSFAWDHPRLCGEKQTGAESEEMLPGSPPPMRGKASGFDSVTAVFGITPAYAGKSTNQPFSRPQRQDHPRLCGEKRKLSRLLIFSLGSPPPMRGKVFAADYMTRAKGITPAYAGKSQQITRCRHSQWDHPRLCGEKLV